MDFQVGRSRRRIRAEDAHKGLFVRMRHGLTICGLLLKKKQNTFLVIFFHKSGLVPAALMPRQIATPSTSKRTLGARKWLLARVRAHMHRQLLVGRTRIRTHATRKGPLACMRPHVHRQIRLVFARIRTQATGIGLFACVPPHVHRQMGLLCRDVGA